MFNDNEKTIALILKDVDLSAIPGQKIEVTWGDVVRIKASIQYRGSALSDYLYGAIGKRGLISFDEIIHAQQSIYFDQSLTFKTFNFQVDIPITTDISAGTDYDIYVKIKGHLEAGLPEVDDCIDVIGAPEFQNFQITSFEKIAGA